MSQTTNNLTNIFSDIQQKVSDLIQAYHKLDLQLVTAESCTGGMLGSIITSVSGASKIYAGGFITYSNQLKIQCLAVPLKMLQCDGAVSYNVAEAMALGALKKCKHANVSIALTGIAGPDGATPNKPIGLVYISVAKMHPLMNKTTSYVFAGDRNQIQQAACYQALTLLFSIIN